MREPFLINPMELDPYSGEFESVPMSYEYGKSRVRGKMKKRRKLKVKKVTRKSMLRGRAKRSIREGSRHHILALQRHGHLFTSPRARLVRKGLRLNPLSESLMLVGSNPKRRKGGKSMARRRMRHNPMAVVKQVTDMAPSIATGVLAMVIPERVANFVDPLGGYTNIGARLGIIVGGNFAVKAIAGPNNAELWLLFGLAKLAKDLADKYVFNPLASMIVSTGIPANMPGVAGLSAPIFPNNRTLSASIGAPVRPLRNFKGNLYNINA